MAEPVTPMIGNVELRSVQRIATSERRALVEHRVPGLAGSVFQDLGRAATAIEVVGLLFGRTARQDLEALRRKFQEAELLPFTADITTATGIIDVVIEDLRVVEVAGRPDTFATQLVLREAPPPPPPIPAVNGLDEGIAGEARGLFDQAVGLTDAIGLIEGVPELADPTLPLNGLLQGVASATSGLPDALAQLTDLFAESDA